MSAPPRERGLAPEDRSPPRYVPRPGTIPTLQVPDPSAWRRLHLIGIGGAGMSGMARLLMARGIGVSGSDLKDSPGLWGLREAGASVFVGHRPEQVGGPDLPPGVGVPDAVVISSAIPPENPELRRARAEGIPVLMRAQVLAALTRGRRVVAVSGTHGKTTTTSMISVVLERAGLSPTFVIGGDLNESGSGAGHGTGDVFVAEADESDGTFLLLSPHVAVVTNVEEDHLDFYPQGRGEVEAAFREFAARSESVVACRDDDGSRRSLAGVSASTPIVWYGFGEGSDLLVRDFRAGPGEARGTVVHGGIAVDVALSVPGRHNLLNAAAALCVADRFGVPLGEAADALRSFTGVRRRFERRGKAGGAVFVDDYAHHPTEVAATLEAAAVQAAGLGGRLVAVFQPHRYTRTQSMWRSMGESLVPADLVVITDVYPAGELPIPGVSGKLLVDAVAESRPGGRVVYLPRRSEVAPFLAGEVRAGDLILTLGAGDITTVADEAIELIGEAG